MHELVVRPGRIRRRSFVDRVAKFRVEAEAKLKSIGVPSLVSIYFGIVPVHHGRGIADDPADIKRFRVVHEGQSSALHLTRFRGHVDPNLAGQIPIVELAVNDDRPRPRNHEDTIIASAGALFLGADRDGKEESRQEGHE